MANVVGVAALLPRFYRRMLELEDERKLAKVLLESGGSLDDVGTSRLARGADGHDWERRRGLPIIGRGVSGARYDTNPVAALLAKERRNGGNR